MPLGARLRVRRPGLVRRGGRVVECGGLENRYGCKLIEGSNPSLSASGPASGRGLRPPLLPRHGARTRSGLGKFQDCRALALFAVVRGEGLFPARHDRSRGRARLEDRPGGRRRTGPLARSASRPRCGRTEAWVWICAWHCIAPPSRSAPPASGDPGEPGQASRSASPDRCAGASRRRRGSGGWRAAARPRPGRSRARRPARSAPAG